jgi:streptogramin lyase
MNRYFLLGAATLAALFAMGCNSDKGTSDATKCPSTTETCPGDTTTLVITVTAPAGVATNITVSGPEGFTKQVHANTRFSGVKAGLYEISGPRVKVAAVPVGKAFYALIDANIASEQLTLRPSIPDTVSVVYTQEPGSGKLWVIEDSIKAFSAEALLASGSPMASATFPIPPRARSLAFDAGGNLWFTHAEGISMIAMRDLGTSNAPASVVLTGAGAQGVGQPGASGLAFDASGNLWVAYAADDVIARFTPAQLMASGMPTPAIRFSGSDLKSPDALAFDAEGNLWVTSSEGPAILKYQASRLTASYSGVADIAITTQSPPPIVGTYTDPQALAFDASNNLWISYGGSTLVRLTAAQRALSDSALVPEIIADVSVLSLANSMAFDGGGQVWLPGKVGEILAAGSTTLGTSEALSAAVTLTPPGFGYAGSLAFDPAPEALPLRDHKTSLEK